MQVYLILDTTWPEGSSYIHELSTKMRKVEHKFVKLHRRDKRRRQLKAVKLNYPMGS